MTFSSGVHGHSRRFAKLRASFCGNTRMDCLSQGAFYTRNHDHGMRMVGALVPGSTIANGFRLFEANGSGLA